MFYHGNSGSGSGPAQAVILVPAYNPPASFPALIRELLRHGAPSIVVVNDGSASECDILFDEIGGLPGVTVLRHAVNMGKGAALKTALNFAYCEFPACPGFITADADGQHVAADILSVARRFAESPELLVLGVRSFTVNVPLRSRLGNRLTRVLVRWFIGQTLSDTQTGLRGIPRSLTPTLLKIPANGYEFELDMLIAAKHASVRTREVPIRTIYSDGNRSSSFNPILDSMKIYFVLLRFGGVALLTAILDNAVFLLTYAETASVLGSQIAARIVAMGFNYTAARKAVFLSRESHRNTLVKYVLLVSVNASLSYALIGALHGWTGLAVPWAKIAAETLLFLGNFALQREFVFTGRAGRDGSPESTDWTEYYAHVPPTARMTRRYTTSVLVRALTRYSPPNVNTIVEIGGANSCFVDSILRGLRPEQYRVIDTNEHGLELLRKRFPDSTRVQARNADVLDLSAESDPADVVFSVGLVEHFSVSDTARAVRAHFDLVREGGLVVISFPTPTKLYRAARAVCEAVGVWRFPDERPLDIEEVMSVAGERGAVVFSKTLWPLVFTQHMIAVKAGTRAAPSPDEDKIEAGAAR